jgi:hypothetical protein
MRSRFVARLVLLPIAGFLALGVVPSLGTAAPGDTASKVEDSLRRMASAEPDGCNASDIENSPANPVPELENQLFEAAKTLVVDRLNAEHPASGSEAKAHATSALRELEQLSVKYNKSWPDENRFHFEVLDISPAIVVRMSYRAHAVMALFGSYYLSKSAATDPGTKWREASFVDPNEPASGLELYPLHRGPNGHARFLAKVWRSGCAGSIGEAYYGYEWNPGEGQSPVEIIKIEGAEGADDAASTHVGKLRTTGETIQLPYCFFSAVDTWDNPTLCAADSFDLAANRPAFIGRTYNRPDLVTVARAIQYAEAHDYNSVRGYCASNAVARLLVRNTPPDLFAESLEVVRLGPGHEKVVLADGGVTFELTKRQSEWLIVKFKTSTEGQ